MSSLSTSTTPAEFEITAAGKKPGERIQCVVVTPERTMFDELVEFVALPLLDGELGVLPGRSPLLGRLGFGELRTKSSGGSKRYFVDGGFAQVRDNVVTVLTNRAIPTDQLDLASANSEMERAKTQRSGNEQESAEKTRLTDRARAMVRIAGQPNRG